MRVVEALDEPEHLHARLGPGAETVASEELALQRGEKALTQRVVVAVPDRTHGGTHARLPAALPKGDRGVLRALVGIEKRERQDIHGGIPRRDPAAHASEDATRRWMLCIGGCLARNDYKPSGAHCGMRV